MLLTFVFVLCRRQALLPCARFKGRWSLREARSKHLKSCAAALVHLMSRRPPGVAAHPARRCGVLLTAVTTKLTSELCLGALYN